MYSWESRGTLGKDLERDFDICSADSEDSLNVFEYRRDIASVVFGNHMVDAVQGDGRKERRGLIGRLLQ